MNDGQPHSNNIHGTLNPIVGYMPRNIVLNAFNDPSNVQAANARADALSGFRTSHTRASKVGHQELDAIYSGLTLFIK
jgi:hypothetical protein